MHLYAPADVFNNILSDSSVWIYNGQQCCWSTHCESNGYNSIQVMQLTNAYEWYIFIKETSFCLWNRDYPNKSHRSNTIEKQPHITLSRLSQPPQHTNRWFCNHGCFLTRMVLVLLLVSALLLYVLVTQYLFFFAALCLLYSFCEIFINTYVRVPYTICTMYRAMANV